MTSQDNHNTPQPLTLDSVNFGIITSANSYLALALPPSSEQIACDGKSFEEKIYRIPTGEVIYVHKKGEFVYRIATGDGDAYEMRIMEDDQQTLGQNKLEAAITLILIYDWYHRHDQ